MLNQNLKISELQKELEEYIDVIDLIQEEILGDQKKPLVNDKKRLGKIHHALNIENYKNQQFRYHLLEHTPDELLLPFFKELGWHNGTKIESMKRYELVKKASLLKWGNNVETRTFVKIFGYDENLVPILEENPPYEETIESSGKPLNSLWKYQSEVFYKAIDVIENKFTRFIILMPTGAGKTKTAMEVITHFLNNGTINNQKRQVLWIADKEELCEQAVESFMEIWPHRGKIPLKLYRFWKKSNTKEFEKNSFIVSTYGKLKGILDKDVLHPDLIICDEAHNAIAPTYKNTTRKLSENGACIIGLTATPVRGIKTLENDELRDFFFDQIFDFDMGNEENAIQYLQKNGYLSYYKQHTIPSNVRFRISRELLKLIAMDRDLPSSFLQEIAKSEERNKEIAKLLHELGERKIKVLYFAPSIGQSKLMCALLISFGYEATHIDGNTPTEYRQDSIKKFRKGQIKILCNFGVFTTGFDDPKIDAVVIGRPTTSIVLHTQMIGRGMRGPKMGGTEYFELYRISDELPGLELADSFFKDVWGYGS